ncbi:MAG: hypothetical protein ABW321_05240 [Polyangiales bacterium]
MRSDWFRIGSFVLCLGLVAASRVEAQEAAASSENPADPESSVKDDQGKQDDENKKKADKPVPTIDVVRAAMEPAYIAYPVGLSGLDPLIFESNVVAHFIVWRPWWPVALVLSPKVVLRMFREESAPVKSPSYMPRVTAYFWFTREIRDLTLYGSVMLSHHSNGQAESFFEDSGAVRHDGGSFSTNYFEFSLYATGFSGRWFGWSSLSFEWHPGFNQSAELRGRYGLARMHFASTVLANLPLKGQLNLRVSAILDDFMQTQKSGVLRAVERFPISARYTITVPGIELGLYVGYYLGHDYYNIFFDRMVHTLQIGISGGVTPALGADD